MDEGESFSEVMSACWVGVISFYFDHPNLRREYSVVQRLSECLNHLLPYGYRGFNGISHRLDDKPYFTLLNDMGPQQLTGWLGRIIYGTEEAGPEEDWIGDESARELSIDGRRIPLTRLEWECFKLLLRQRGKAVSRMELLSEVWGYDTDIGSNVVDVKIRSIRKKLGDWADRIETVSGVGYRLK